MKYDIIATRGHMEPQKKGDAVHVVDEVIVRIRDGYDIVVGRGVSEDDAVTNGLASLERFRHDQEVLGHPAVAAAREAYVAAIDRATRERDG